MKRALLTAMLLAVSVAVAFAQTADDYRSAATGIWPTVAIWERYNGTAWVAAAVAPNSANGAITIRNGHTVTSGVNRTIDQTTIEAGGQLTVSGGTLTLANGAGTDLTCSGTLYNSSGNNITTTGTIVFTNGGVYNHAFDGGNVPTSTWNTGSTCLITGMTGNDPGGFGQSFYNYIWNCPNQTAEMREEATIPAINGNFEIYTTGTGTFTLTRNTNGVNLNVGGNFKISGGTFRLSSGSGSPILTLLGNFEMTGGTITETDAGTGTFRFAKSGTQTFIKSAGTISQTINFEVMNGSTTLLGASIIDGSIGYFTLNSGGTLGIGSPNGITITGTASGNVQVTGTRTYSTGANYIYNGTAAQVTGSSLPATVNCLTINNGSGVTLSGSVSTVTDTLTMTAGSLSLGAYTLAYGAAGKLKYNGSAAQTAGAGEWPTANGPRDLFIDNASGVSLAFNRILSGTLNLATGVLGTGSNTITISSNNAVNRGSGYVNGNLAMYTAAGATTKTFTVGTASGYSPVTVFFANVATSGTLTCKAFQSVHPNVAIPLNCLQRYWTVSNAGVAFNNYSATFTYLPGDFNIGFTEAGDEATMVAGKFGGSWSLPTIGTRSAGGSADGGSLQITGLTAFSDFTMAKNAGALDGALSVSLSSFAALVNNFGGVTLSWRTESETDCYYSEHILVDRPVSSQPNIFSVFRVFWW